MKKLLLLSLVTLVSYGLCSCGSSNDKTIVVGATPSPHAEILNSDAVQNYVKEKGYELSVKVYQDYVTPNKALADSAIDANYFQHVPYMLTEIEEKGYAISAACQVHNEPLNLYGKVSTVDFTDKTVYIVNDKENIERALKLLVVNGLIDTYDIESVGTTAPSGSYTTSIGVKLLCVDGGLLHNHVDSGSYAVIPGNYALTAWGAEKAASYKVFGETSDVAYPNIITVRDSDIHSAKTTVLCEALATDACREFIEETYGPTVNYCFKDYRLYNL